VHRFLSPETAACFDGVTTTQVRADLAEMEAGEGFGPQATWVWRLPNIDDAFDAGLRFIADRERAEIAERLRGFHAVARYFEDFSSLSDALADELDPED
jgi:hypothetical protein